MEVDDVEEDRVATQGAVEVGERSAKKPKREGQTEQVEQQQQQQGDKADKTDKRDRAEEQDNDREEEWQVDTVQASEASRVQQLCGQWGSAGGAELLRPAEGRPARVLRTCEDHPWSLAHLAAMLGDLDALRGLAETTGEHVLCSIQVGQVAAAKWLYRRGKGPGQELPRGKLLSLAIRSQSPELVHWALQVEDADLLEWETAYKLFSTCFLYPLTRCSLAVALAEAGGARLASIGVACAAARQCDDACAALVAAGAVLRKTEYRQLLEQLPPGTFIEMVRGVLRALPEGLPLSTVLEEKPSLLLLHSVVVGSPDLCNALLMRGARVDPPTSSALTLTPSSSSRKRQNKKQKTTSSQEDVEEESAFWSNPLWACCMGVPPRCRHFSRLKLGTDHSVALASLLLGTGQVSPFLHDSKGNRLLDALWVGLWWCRSRDRSPQRASFELEDNRLRLVLVVQHWMCQWTPKRHLLFPAPHRNRVFTLICCNAALKRQSKPWLPKDLIKLVLQWLAVAEATDEEALRRALGTFTMDHIRDVVLDRSNDVGQEAVKKARKYELVELAVRAKEESEQHTRMQLATGATLPAVIGRLIGREERTGTTFMLDIVNPTRQPWINIGRSFIKHPKGGANLDMDLSPVEFSRRISRLHATIRYNVISSQWEVQIRGRNGLEIDSGSTSGPEIQLPSQDWIPLPPSLTFRMPFANLSFELVDLVHSSNGSTKGSNKEGEDPKK